MVRRPLRWRGMPSADGATQQKWHPTGEPYRTWDASAADDRGCAGAQVFAVRWGRPGVLEAAIWTCFYPAYFGPAADDGYILGVMWQQQAGMGGGPPWVHTGWDALDAWDATVAQSTERAQAAAARFSDRIAGLPELSDNGINPFDWDGVPHGAGFGKPLPPSGDTP
jgi:hypothetical protein